MLPLGTHDFIALFRGARLDVANALAARGGAA